MRLAVPSCPRIQDSRSVTARGFGQGRLVDGMLRRDPVVDGLPTTNMDQIQTSEDLAAA
jgi:hypothetical protein